MLNFIINRLLHFNNRLHLKRQCKKFINFGNTVKMDGLLLNVNLVTNCTESQIIVEKGAVVRDTTIYLKGKKHKLIIGKDVSMKGGKISLEGDESNIVSIGEKTTIEDALISATECNSKVLIGEDCMFSNKIEIRNGDSHSILQNGERINQGGDVVIGNHVWIGSEAMVLKNVTIESNAIVAAKSLVTKSVSTGLLVGGVPAKTIKTDVNWDRVLL